MSTQATLAARRRRSKAAFSFRCRSAYVALAESLGASLLTGDASLANAPGVRARVELF